MTHRLILQEKGKIGYNTEYYFKGSKATLYLKWRGKEIAYDDKDYKPGDYIFVIFGKGEPKIGLVKGPKELSNFIMWAMGVSKGDRYIVSDKYLERLKNLEKLTGKYSNISSTESTIAHQVTNIRPDGSIAILAMVIDNSMLPENSQDRNEYYTELLINLKKAKNKVPVDVLLERLSHEKFTITQMDRIYENWTEGE